MEAPKSPNSCWSVESSSGPIVRRPVGRPRGHRRPAVRRGVNNLYKCWTCQREFSCGQALGGHRKVHVMERRRPTEAPPITYFSIMESIRRAQRAINHPDAQGSASTNSNPPVARPRTLWNSSHTPLPNFGRTIRDYGTWHYGTQGYSIPSTGRLSIIDVLEHHQQKLQIRRRPEWVTLDHSKINANRVMPETNPKLNAIEVVPQQDPSPNEKEVFADQQDPEPNGNKVAPQQDPGPDVNKVAPEQDPEPNANEAATPRQDAKLDGAGSMPLEGEDQNDDMMEADLLGTMMAPSDPSGIGGDENCEGVGHANLDLNLRLYWARN